MESKRDSENFSQVDERVQAALEAGYVSRAPEPADVENLARVHVAVWQEAYVGMVSQAYLDGLTTESSKQLWTELLSDNSPRPAARYVAVAQDGSIVGIAASGTSRSVEVVEVEELYDLQVLKEYRGTGVSDLLMHNALASRSAELWVVEGNARAQAFYRRHGFIPNGDSDRIPDLGITEIRMVRK
jgi:ribosomal protein S18 acetylase RimI-like enzyme